MNTRIQVQYCSGLIGTGTRNLKGFKRSRIFRAGALVVARREHGRRAHHRDGGGVLA